MNLKDLQYKYGLNETTIDLIVWIHSLFAYLFDALLYLVPKGSILYICTNYWSLSLTPLATSSSGWISPRVCANCIPQESMKSLYWQIRHGEILLPVSPGSTLLYPSIGCGSS